MTSRPLPVGPPACRPDRFVPRGTHVEHAWHVLAARAVRRPENGRTARNPGSDIVSMLVGEGLLDEATASQTRELEASGRPLDDAIREAMSANGSNGTSEEKLLRYLAGQFQIPYAELEGVNPPKELVSKFPARLLLEHRLLPLSDTADGVLVATSRVFDMAPLDELRLATGIDVLPALAPAAEIDRTAKRILGVGADTLQSMGATDAEATAL